MHAVPVELIKLDADHLGISWSDGHRSRYFVRTLRLSCRCAMCVDEWTQESRLDPTSVPHDVHPVDIQSVGRYALNFLWSDGHDTGYFTFEQLRRLCECEACHPHSH